MPNVAMTKNSTVRAREGDGLVALAGPLIVIATDAVRRIVAQAHQVTKPGEHLQEFTSGLFVASKRNVNPGDAGELPKVKA